MRLRQSLEYSEIKGNEGLPPESGRLTRGWCVSEPKNVKTRSSLLLNLEAREKLGLAQVLHSKPILKNELMPQCRQRGGSVGKES